MIQIFRVQHKETKVGPFQTDNDFTQHLAEHTNGPIPYHDGLDLGFIPWTYVFGCLSVESLKQWFTIGDIAIEDVCDQLESLGFCVVEYLVEDGDYIIGDSRKQVTFCASWSEDDMLTQVHPMSILLK